MDVSVVGDTIVLEDLDRYDDRVTRSLVRAMNRSVKSGRTAIARLIAQDTKLPYRAVLNVIPVQEATAGRQEARVSANLRRLRLSEFKVSGPFPSRGRGRVTADTGQGRKHYAGAFLARVRGRSGITLGPTGDHTGVFIRGTAPERRSRGAWGKNLPIAELMGPSIGQVFRKHRAAGITRMLDVFDQNFDHEMGWEQRRVAPVSEPGEG